MSQAGRMRCRSTRAPAHCFAVHARTLQGEDTMSEVEASEAESLSDHEGMAEVASSGMACQRSQLTPSLAR